MRARRRNRFDGYFSTGDLAYHAASRTSSRECARANKRTLSRHLLVSVSLAPSACLCRGDDAVVNCQERYRATALERASVCVCLYAALKLYCASYAFYARCARVELADLANYQRHPDGYKEDNGPGRVNGAAARRNGAPAPERKTSARRKARGFLHFAAR